jgi:hypothetical protein
MADDITLAGDMAQTIPDTSASGWKRVAPALALMILAPLVAEVLPGATRFSSLFVLPVEIAVWGGGALMIRVAVRRLRLGWRNMLCLALALAVAEECLIQQTSLAPMVFQLKGQGYARAFGVNYVYLLWALVYESVFVVFVPIYLVELIFPLRRQGLWLNRGGLVAVVCFFVVGCFMAWFSWTQVARPQVFHVAAYNPPLPAVLIAAVVIAGLLIAAVGPYRDLLATAARPLDPPAHWLLGVAGFLWALLWYGLVLLSFGVAPDFPSAIAVGTGLLLVAAILLWLPRWTAHAGWSSKHAFGLLFGTIVGSMLAGFIGFIGSLAIDLAFKVLVDVLAVVLLAALGRRVWDRNEAL